MKGLIIKDIMCLKKQLKTFIYVIVSVMIISVMYVFSARFGNLALAGSVMLDSNDLTFTDVKNLGSLALVLFMLLPIVSVGDMVNVFDADGKSGFYKVAGALPVSAAKRLLARYITIYALFGLGVLIDILIAIILSFLTDLISFREFLGIILSTASVMSIYSALAIFFCLLLGYGKEQYAQVFSLITMMVVFVLVKFKSLKKIMTEIENAGSGSPGNVDNSFNWGILDFIKEKAWILVLTAVGISVLSYIVSLAVIRRKRGLI